MTDDNCFLEVRFLRKSLQVSFIQKGGFPADFDFANAWYYIHDISRKISMEGFYLGRLINFISRRVSKGDDIESEEYFVKFYVKKDNMFMSEYVVPRDRYSLWYIADVLNVLADEIGIGFVPSKIVSVGAGMDKVERMEFSDFRPNMLGVFVGDSVIRRRSGSSEVPEDSDAVHSDDCICPMCYRVKYDELFASCGKPVHLEREFGPMGDENHCPDELLKSEGIN